MGEFKAKVKRKHQLKKRQLEKARETPDPAKMAGKKLVAKKEEKKVEKKTKKDKEKTNKDKESQKIKEKGAKEREKEKGAERPKTPVMTSIPDQQQQQQQQQVPNPLL